MTEKSERFVETVGKELKRCSTLDSLCSDLLKELNPPFYASFDVRDAGYKIAPVDANMFPAGWNNLSDSQQKKVPQFIQEWFLKNLSMTPKGQKLLLVSENHTENSFYFENIRVLASLLGAAGFEVRIGCWQHPLWGETKQVATSSGAQVVIHPIQISACSVSVDNGWKPDAVLFNNDCSTDPGDIWDMVKVPVMPPIAFGWHRRRKSWFFSSWNAHAEVFAKCLSLDPWYFQVRTQSVGQVDFKSEQGLKELAETVDRVVAQLADDYRPRKINHRPAVFVKHASGTYGMGIMTVQSGQELLQLNRREKNKMSVGKGKRFIDEVIVQESLPSAMRSDTPDEPVIYTVGFHPVGGFLRVNTSRGAEENLNSRGMSFAPLNSIAPAIVDVYSSIGFQCTVALAQEMKHYGP